MLSVSRKAVRPRVQFNPRGYKRARKTHENGDSRKLIRMMKEATIDSHVSGCLGGRRSGFKRRYTLTAYDDQDADMERRDWFAGVLQRLRLRDLLEAVHDSRLFLYTVIDFEWEVADGRQVPTAFKAFEQHYFRKTKDGELRIDFGPGDLREIPETALVCETVKMPLMLPVLRDWILKEFGLESWASFLETFGEAFIMGKYPPGVDDEYKNAVEKGVNALASSSRGIAPEGTSLEIHEASRTTGDHQAFSEYADQGISIQLLGHKNAVEDSGAINVGGVQTSYEVRFDLARDDMHYLEPFINRLITLIGERNFADGRYPKFELDKSPPVSKTEHAEIVNMAWRHGLPIYPDEYRKLGLYVAEDQEPIERETSSIDRLLD